MILKKYCERVCERERAPMCGMITSFTTVLEYGRSISSIPKTHLKAEECHLITLKLKT